MPVNEKMIGVIGSGQMGQGIAIVVAKNNYQAVLFDEKKEQLIKAQNFIVKYLDRQIEKNKLQAQNKEEILNRLVFASNLDEMANSALIIEAVTEMPEIKYQVVKIMDEIANKDAILASNTSSLSITALASRTKRPDKFIGLHFMNPVPAMDLVEIIKGISTSNHTYDFVSKFVKTLGKQQVLSADFPGFIVNRILIPMINEAVYALYEGVSNVEEIDKAMKIGANHPVGPLYLADFIGLDTCLSILRTLQDGLSSAKHRPCPLLVKYVEAGWLGCKTGRGFYDHSGEKPIPTR